MWMEKEGKTSIDVKDGLYAPMITLETQQGVS